MAFVSQWAGIESGASTAPSVAAASADSTDRKVPARPVEPRLRRSDHLVLGSIDAAAHVLQRRARVVLVGSAVFMLPMLALNLLLSVLAFNDFEGFDNLFADRGYVGVESGGVLVALIVQSFTAHLVGAYGASLLVTHQMGGEARIAVSVKAVVRRLPMLLLTWLLTHWWAVLMALLVVSEPALAAGLAIFGIPFIALCTTCVLLTVPVLMTEGTGVSSIGRGYRLARSRFGAAFAFVLACGLLGGLLFLFIAQLPALLEQTGLVTFGSFGGVVQGITTQIALLVVIPLSALATAQWYLQVRVVSEGIDLSMAADRAFGARS
jgi:uncharacterized membrane protein